MKLPWYLCELAVQAGAKRQLLALHDKLDRGEFDPSDPWGPHIESCGSEISVALEFNRFWIPWARKPSQIVADVGTNIQVRWSKREGHLLLNRKDPDEHLYVYVVGQLPMYECVGWMYGHEAKGESVWGDKMKIGRVAFWNPSSTTRPMDRFAAALAESGG